MMLKIIKAFPKEGSGGGDKKGLNMIEQILGFN